MGLVISRGDPTKLLEIAEEVFDSPPIVGSAGTPGSRRRRPTGPDRQPCQAAAEPHVSIDVCSKSDRSRQPALWRLESKTPRAGLSQPP